ncbi:MAG: SPOR domain-containing protein [Zoogloeaceae bacterium]|jgi:DedD protein|nr:SPOR domain-containing protein [Zoogloeaceae bacterium]
MNDADDAQQELKKKARRRLVGAIAFAAFAALALPLVMVSEPQTPEQDVEIRLPDPNTAAALPLPDAASATPAIPLAPSEPAAPETISAPPAPATNAAPQPPKPAAQAAPQPARPVAVVTPKPDPAAEAEARRAADILSGRGSATMVASAASADVPHVVQIGAFTDAAKVENLKKKLAELKIRVYTEALNSPQGAMTRVRAGPFKNRATADAALDKIQRNGISGAQVLPQS